MNTIFFDINETVLDLSALDPLFGAWFGHAGARREWFAQTLHIAMTLAATRHYRSFAEIGIAALSTVAERHDVELPGDVTAQLQQALVRLPAHPEAAAALQVLRDAGFRAVALSNNPLAMLREQLAFSGLAPLFAEVISVEEAGALKPAPEVYRYALERLGSAPDTTWMVAAHGWDIAGASRAGLRGAFVARPGQVPDPFAPPEIIGADLVEVAGKLRTLGP